VIFCGEGVVRACFGTNKASLDTGSHIWSLEYLLAGSWKAWQAFGTRSPGGENGVNVSIRASGQNKLDDMVTTLANEKWSGVSGRQFRSERLP
jgi:hypothetical protein